MTKLGSVVVTNLHRRFTGVSATVAALVPIQRRDMDITLVDSGNLDLPGKMSFWKVLCAGWTPAPDGWRVWHARRDIEMLAGLFLRHVLRQRWKLLFTSAAPKRHGWFLRFVMNRMDAIVATSARSAAFLDWHSRIVPHGVDTDWFSPPKDKLTAFIDSGLPGRYGIGCFGRIRPSKGTHTFVEAMIELLPDHPDFTAFITGLSSGTWADYQVELQEKIKGAGLQDRIVFLGDLNREEVRTWYRRCLICVAASEREGFGLTPMEAMASGAVVVTSGAGYWPELMAPETGGAMFDTGNAASLVTALRPYLDTPEATAMVGEKARALMVGEHSIDVEAAALNEIYRALASDNLTST
ncbi:glycosyltransferase family 4 protein [Halovulum sp. GXIMD14793]